MDSKFAFREEMKVRTKKFALRIIRLSQSLPKNREADIISRQIVRSATSVGANYRSACVARSLAEFRSKLSIVIEECDETLFWLELLVEGEFIKLELLQSLMREANEILKICSTARKKVAN
ncbi:MAG: four helix bundle protein [Paludibacteraceae bacterium]|jgi:four helix bundle protein|nr:four helix bundle protein [Paludibacteraceae bacterium]